MSSDYPSGQGRGGKGFGTASDTAKKEEVKFFLSLSLIDGGMYDSM